MDKAVLSICRSMEGVVHADLVPDSLRKTLLKEEEKYASLGPISIDNAGVRIAIEKRKLYVIIKDERFRPPPIPTVVLMNESGEILGEEIIAGKTPEERDGEQFIHLGKDFIIYTSRAKGRGRNSKFVLPPVPFPEIETLEFARGVMSASPSTMGDIALKNAVGIEDDPRFASILIAFDID